MPTTQTASGIEAGLGYERVRPDLGRVRFFPVVTATYGLRRSEIGVGYLRERFTGPGFALTTNFYTVHAKHRLIQNPRTGGALAVGAHYLDFGDAGGSTTSLYLTGSYPLLQRPDGSDRLRAHAGVIYHRISGSTARDREVRPMVGLEYRASRGLTIAGDYLPERSDVARLKSLVVRYESRSGWGAQVGAGRLQSDSKVFASVLYRFGGRNEVASRDEVASPDEVNSPDEQVVD